jgi:uncharacterized protein YndB with AHSA1/START domain/predicted enzyme related to lactoylglutathione lyase
MTTTHGTIPSLTIRRTFAAPRERVFAAFTDPGILRRWFGPGNRVHTVTCDARLGGSYRIEMTSSEGEAFNVGGTFTEFRAPERLAYTFRWEEDAPELEIDTRVSIDFLERDGRTEMVFTHENLASEASRDRHQTGGTESFDNLAAAIARPFAIAGIDLSGYMCQDGARAIAFYRDVLGLEPTLVYPDNRGAEFDLPDGTTFGLWGGGGKVMPFQPGNGILFAVDDLDAAVAAVKARGIAVAYETETPNCFMAMFPDSEGNSIFLHRRKAR